MKTNFDNLKYGELILFSGISFQKTIVSSYFF